MMNSTISSWHAIIVKERFGGFGSTDSTFYYVHSGDQLFWLASLSILEVDLPKAISNVGSNVSENAIVVDDSQRPAL